MKLLLIMPRFFNYPEVITDELKEMGWDKEIHCSLIKICCPFLVKPVTIYIVFTKVPEANLAGGAPEPFTLIRTTV